MKIAKEEIVRLHSFTLCILRNVKAFIIRVVDPDPNFLFLDCVINVVKKAFFVFLKISFYIGRIRIRNDNTGSGSEENIPDPTGSGSATLLIITQLK